MRLGDRKDQQGDSLSSFPGDYFALLEAFMDTVTSAVVTRGHERPVFHIFSETHLPCPSDDGSFPEFPDWPVEMGEVGP